MRSESLRVDHGGRAYLVAYWNDAQRKEEWVYEWELAQAQTRA